MKKQLLLLTLLAAAAAVPVSAQTDSNVPQFPPNGGSSQNQTEVYNPAPEPPRKKRYIVPAIRIAFGVMTVICSETGRCLENDFRRQPPQNNGSVQVQQPLNSGTGTNQGQGILQNLFRQLTNRRP